LAAGTRLVFTEPSDDDRFRVSALVVVYEMEIVVGPPAQVGCALTAAVTVGGLDGGAATVRCAVAVGVGVGVVVGLAVGVGLALAVVLVDGDAVGVCLSSASGEPEP